MNIVFIGDMNDRGAVRHVDAHRESHEVWVAPLEQIKHEVAAQKIGNADAVHIWLSTGMSGSAMSFYLGMAFMQEQLGICPFEVKLFNEVHDPGSILGQLSVSPESGTRICGKCGVLPQECPGYMERNCCWTLSTHEWLKEICERDQGPTARDEDICWDCPEPWTSCPGCEIGWPNASHKHLTARCKIYAEAAAWKERK